MDRWEMFQDTLAFARSNIEWYRDPRYDVTLTEPGDLARLPIISRDDFEADPTLFASSTTEWPAGVTYSSGTTGRLGLARWHSPAELAAMDELWVGAPPNPGDDEMALVIQPNDQGPALTRPGQRNVAYVRLLHPWHFELVHDILRDGWKGPAGVQRISCLQAYSPVLRLLTCWLEDRGIDPATFGVRHLEGFGSIQTAPWRRRLRRSWGATYQDLYGLSEVKMSTARQCTICDSYHLDLPIVAEVLDPVSRGPVTDGAGVLVLSELWPYAQLQVLLRYWTDDLVEVTQGCVGFGSGFQLLGRRRDSAVVEVAGPRPVVVGALQAVAACAELPDVAVDDPARRDLEGSPRWGASGVDAGEVRCALSTEGRAIRLAVGLRYPVDLFPDRAREVAAIVEQRLRTKVNGLDDTVADGEVELEIVLRGSDQALVT